MMIIGVDYHPSFQTIAFFVEETGECGEQELKHSDGEAERFYRGLQHRGIRVRVGMDATGYSRWFELARFREMRLLPCKAHRRQRKRQKQDLRQILVLEQRVQAPGQREQGEAGSRLVALPRRYAASL